jgi:hypothetical protein
MEKLTEQEKHQLKIAKAFLEMPETLRKTFSAMLSDKEAREIVDKLEAKELKEESEKI